MLLGEPISLTAPRSFNTFFLALEGFTTDFFFFNSGAGDETGVVPLTFRAALGGRLDPVPDFEGVARPPAAEPGRDEGSGEVTVLSRDEGNGDPIPLRTVVFPRAAAVALDGLLDALDADADF